MVGVSGPDHSRVMRRGATMYRQGCVAIGRGGVGSRGVQGGPSLLGMQGDRPRSMLCGDLPGQWSPSGKAVHRPAKALIPAAHGEHRVRGPAPRGATKERGSSGLSSMVYVSWPWFCGGGVVGRKEGLGAVDQPGVGWCAVVVERV